MTVGTTRSRVSSGPFTAAVGDAVNAASFTAPKASTGLKVPVVEQVLTVRVTVVPVAAETAKVQPVAVPALLKSAAANPVMASLNVTVNAFELVFEGETTAVVMVAVAAVRSMVIGDITIAEAGPALPQNIH